MTLSTNFFQISFDAEEFEIERLPYSQGKLRELRGAHNATHSFFRTDDFIYASAMGADPLGLGEIVSLNVYENEPIVSSLLKHVFFRTFRREFSGIIPLSFYPFRILSRRDEDDMIANLLPRSLKGVLSRKKQYEVQFRELRSKGEITFGTVINLRYRWIFHRTCLDLLDEEFDLYGKQVLLSEQVPGLENVLAPDESLVGSILNISDNNATVETNEGSETYDLRDLYLHKSSQNIADYLAHKLGEQRAEQILHQLRRKDLTRLDAEYYFDEVSRMARWVGSLDYRNKTGFGFSVSKKPTSVIRAYELQTPTFLFDYDAGSSSNRPSAGLVNFGPYDSSTFDLKHPSVLAVFHKKNRGGFTSFLGKLKKGISTSAYFKGGLIGKYRLHDVSFETVELDDYDPEEYGRKIKEHFRSQSSLPDLVIVETRDQFRRLAPQANPYYRVKAYLLSLGIPVQFITNTNARKEDKYLQWICESVALQIYAKLGGRPWVLPASESIDHEIVVGIGSSMLRSNLFVGAERQRIVGITTFFTGDGKYIFGNRCQEVPFEGYFDELLNSLRSSIDEVSQSYGWKPNATIRIVFHIFKPIRNIEAEVVEALLKEYTQYSIRFCFVTISDRHPFLMFDRSQSGFGQKAKGRYVPQARSNWIVDPLSFVLQIKGAEEMKTERHGFSTPVLVRIHEKSTYQDPNFIAQQTYNFAYLSWRGFQAAQQPATILYSDLIAKHLSYMRKIESWKPELINSRLREKKWFL